MSKSNLLVIFQFVLFAVFAGLMFYLPTQQNFIWRIVALIVMLAGGIIGLVAINMHNSTNKNLPNISPEPQQQSNLVTSGPYRYARHPIYTAVILVALGAAIFHGHILLFALTIVFYAFFSYKSMHEESLLQAVYPDYPAYKEQTGRFFPGIK